MLPSSTRTLGPSLLLMSALACAPDEVASGGETGGASTETGAEPEPEPLEPDCAPIWQRQLEVAADVPTALELEIDAEGNI